MIEISTDFPFKSHKTTVLDSKIHYIDLGTGDPILFIHGIPTSSYLWRNIIPYVQGQGRVVAPDLIGLGQSDKPDIEYTVFDHIRYLEAFVEALELTNITLVMHGWGSVIGFSFAERNRDKIKAMAFMEAHVRPAVNVDMVALPVQELLAHLESPEVGESVIVNTNYYVDKVIPNGVLRRLTETELDHYRAPFKQRGSGRPIWQYLHELPDGDGPANVIELIETYSHFLEESTIPKLMLYAVPGFITTMETVQWAKSHCANIIVQEIGEALHYAQESNPEAIGKALHEWLESL